MNYLDLDFWKQYDKNLNVHYMNRYIKFIKSIQDNGFRELSYNEKHHIVPKCVDANYDRDEYLIHLTAREHYIAHRILAKCMTGNIGYRLNHAFVIMVMCRNSNGRDYKVTSKIYEECKMLNSERMKQIMSDEDMKKSISERQSKLMKEKFNGNTFFDSTGIPSHNKGKISITNGIKNKYVYKDEIIPDGWYVGNTQKSKGEEWKQHLKESWKNNKENRVGKNHPMYGRGDLLKGSKNGRYGKPLRYINNGTINKMVSPNDAEEYVRNGWTYGVLRKK